MVWWPPNSLPLSTDPSSSLSAWYSYQRWVNRWMKRDLVAGEIIEME